MARASPDGIEPLSVFREIVRLGEGLKDAGELDSEAVKRAVKVIRGFKILIEEAEVDLSTAVATSAVREAGTEFAVIVSEILGFPVEVISGEREAELTSMGVQGGVGTVENGLIVDIGGGSTEFARIGKGEIIWTSSVHEGVINMTEELLKNDPPTESDLENLRHRVSSMTGDMGEGGDVLVGTAGTPTTLAALDLGIDEYDPTLVNGHVLSRARIGDLSKTLLAMKSSSRLDQPGMEAGREDLIVAGVLMIEGFMDHWGFRELIVSDWGLLEGAALALLGQEVGSSLETPGSFL